MHHKPGVAYHLPSVMFPEDGFENIHFNFWSGQCDEDQSSSQKLFLEQLSQLSQYQGKKSFLLPRCLADLVYAETARLSLRTACCIQFLPLTGIIAVISCSSALLSAAQ